MELDRDKNEEELERLRNENEALREMVGQRGGQPTFVKKSGNKGCGIAVMAIVLMVGGLAVLSIIAAVALPMYSTFKQKSKVGMVLKSINTMEPILITHHEETQSFADLSIDANGGPISQNDARIGAHLPEVNGMNWDLGSNNECVQISFSWADAGGCPAANCDGVYQICYVNGSYSVTIEVGEGDVMGFDKSYELQ